MVDPLFDVRVAAGMLTGWRVEVGGSVRMSNNAAAMQLTANRRIKRGIVGRFKSFPRLQMIIHRGRDLYKPT